LEGLPELHVEPLGHRDARALLESALPGRLDERVLERIILETHGNPLAVLELPRGLTPAQLAGGFGLPAALPLSAQIEESFTRRLARMPRDARRLLLVAAADATGDLALVWRAAQRLGIPESAAHTVESSGLLALGDGIVFRHPLVRSAVYRGSGSDARSEVHRALAEATDPEIDPDRRAWHRAQAAFMPDEDVAADLERSAARALARGGFAAAAAFLERSSTLTPEAARRGDDLAAVGMSNKDGRTVLELEHLTEPGDIVYQRAERELWGSHLEAVGLEALDDAAPEGPVGPSAIDENDVGPGVHVSLTPFVRVERAQV
jgi:hypothetical protein